MAETLMDRRAEAAEMISKAMSEIEENLTFIKLIRESELENTGAIIQMFRERVIQQERAKFRKILDEVQNEFCN